MSERVNMADFIGRQEDTEEEVQKFNIGGEEYTQEEIERFVGLGKIGAEAEEKFNTKLDKVWPEFTKTKNELKQMEEEIEKLRVSTKDTPQQPAQPANFEDEFQKQQAIKAAKDLGLVTMDVLNEMVVKKDEFGQLFNAEFQGNKLAEKALSLEKEIDGADGRPAFNADEVIDYMQKTGINDMEVAYEVMNKDRLDDWKVNKAVELKNQKSKAFNTLDTPLPGGSREPKPIKVTNDNLDEMIKKTLAGEI